MKSSLSNEYYKRKLRDVIKQSKLYVENFDGTFTNLDDRRITIKMDQQFLTISNIRQIAYVCGDTFEYLLNAVDQEISRIEDYLDGDFGGVV